MDTIWRVLLVSFIFDLIHFYSILSNRSRVLDEGEDHILNCLPHIIGSIYSMYVYVWCISIVEFISLFFLAPNRETSHRLQPVVVVVVVRDVADIAISGYLSGYPKHIVIVIAACKIVCLVFHIGFDDLCVTLHCFSIRYFYFPIPEPEPESCLPIDWFSFSLFHISLFVVLVVFSFEFFFRCRFVIEPSFFGCQSFPLFSHSNRIFIV